MTTNNDDKRFELLDFLEDFNKTIGGRFIFELSATQLIIIDTVTDLAPLFSGEVIGRVDFLSNEINEVHAKAIDIIKKK